MTTRTRNNGANNPWKPEEDMLLQTLQKQGLSWNEISRSIPGRTLAACQKRWELYYRPNLSPRIKGRRTYPSDNRVREDRFSDGAPIYEGSYVFRVPAGDPYLQRLIEVHGKDTINRDYRKAV
jgi:hypothetical protein